ncbi:hypothetical protein [Cupriavidus sp. D39]|uniref:hypothetical protein n=1 Tax=Cupriavidus sp. D39 TaxID=2997877 RepID=UPI002270DAD5|nr:hypothetical protein [Cupriavidus sp. D39]MCY0854323.1 hypothetical protein [Cupriavidus sp. D39]
MIRYLLAAALCAPLVVHADDFNGKVIYAYKPVPNKLPAAVVSGLVNMEDIMDEPGSGCEQRVGTVKVEGVQFSSSGATLESFRFTDKKGNQWAVPTNIGNLPGSARGQANNFIRVGKSYYIHLHICGSGRFASLINMYSADQFGQ